MMRMEMVVETLVCSLFNHMTQLIVQWSFIKCHDLYLHKKPHKFHNLKEVWMFTIEKLLGYFICFNYTSVAHKMAAEY